MDGASIEGQTVPESSVEQKMRALTDLAKGADSLPGVKVEYGLAHSSTHWGFDRSLTEAFSDYTNFPNDPDLINALLGDRRDILDMTGEERSKAAQEEPHVNPDRELQVKDFARLGYELSVPTVIENLHFIVSASNDRVPNKNGTFASVVYKAPTPKSE